MPLLVFTLAAACVFCAADAVVIPLIMRPLFSAALGAQMLDTLRLGPAAAFYIVHVGGLAWFAGRPAVNGGSPRGAFVDGAVLGLVAYSCYEMTSWTIMRDWRLSLVLVDIAWGTLISGTAAYAGARAALIPRAARHRDTAPSP
jgi:uncharacterized membrane protein